VPHDRQPAPPLPADWREGAQLEALDAQDDPRVGLYAWLTTRDGREVCWRLDWRQPPGHQQRAVLIRSA
jgi:hypothetical protein